MGGTGSSRLFNPSLFALGCCSASSNVERCENSRKPRGRSLGVKCGAAWGCGQLGWGGFGDAQLFDKRGHKLARRALRPAFWENNEKIGIGRAAELHWPIKMRSRSLRGSPVGLSAFAGKPM